MPLGNRSDFGDSRYAGLEIPFTSKVEGVLQVRTLAGPTTKHPNILRVPVFQNAFSILK